jgi:hypothetical protein
MNIAKELSKFKHIKYYDEAHKYFIGEQQLISGTGFISLYKEKFDSEGMAEKVAKKKKISKQEVLDDWEFKGDFSRTKGTLLHKIAEDYWNNKVFPIDYSVYDERFGEGLMQERLEACKKMFLDFYTESKDSLYPIALELVVGDAELGIAGQIDGLFWSDKRNEIIIIDYKTNKEINEFSKYRKRMLAPISFLQECELTTYSIQLNLYKLLLERNTNLKIGGCYLIHIHEEQEGYALIECKEYQHVVELMIKHYLENKKV